MATRPTRLLWNAERIAKLARRNKIQDRAQMADVLGLGRTTMYQIFDEDWSGTATMTVLVRMAATFNVRISDLVIEPWRQPAHTSIGGKQVA